MLGGDRDSLSSGRKDLVEVICLTTFHIIENILFFGHTGIREWASHQASQELSTSIFYTSVKHTTGTFGLEYNTCAKDTSI